MSPAPHTAVWVQSVHLTDKHFKGKWCLISGVNSSVRSNDLFAKKTLQPVKEKPPHQHQGKAGPGLSGSMLERVIRGSRADGWRKGLRVGARTTRVQVMGVLIPARDDGDESPLCPSRWS